MKKFILDKINSRRILIGLSIFLFFILNFFIVFTTFSEKTSSTIWDGTVASKFKKGNGTAGSPYEINDGSEFVYFLSLINGENYLDYFNKYYVLNNNINFDERDLSFAMSNNTFSGSFDGNGYSLFNFKISKKFVDEEDTSYNYFLFNNLDGAIIENINFSDITLLAGNDIEKEDVIIEKNVTIEDNGTLEENNTKEENKTIEENKTVEENSTKEENNTVEENNTLEENITKEDNSTKEENKTVEENNTKEESNETKEEKVDKKNELEENKTLDDIVGSNESNEDNSTSSVGLNIDKYIKKVANENETLEESNETSGESNETSEESNETVEEKITIDKINIGLFRNVKDSTIKNISVNNIKIKNNSDFDEVNSSLFILNDINGNNVMNININGTSNIHSAQLIYNYNNAKIHTILYYNGSLDLVNGYDNEKEFYKYGFDGTDVVFVKDVTLDDIITLLGQRSILAWAYSNNTFRVVNNGLESPLMRKSLLRIRSGVSQGHASGIDGDTVYVNNYQSDYNYYMGLNYTKSTNGSLPSAVNKEIYTDENLVYVQLNYFGSDIDGDYTGYVSTTEDESKFVYYVVSPVIDILGEDYVRIDLIDNPFADRPNGRVFNGWITQDSDSIIKLDTDTYTRFIDIPVTYSSGIPNSVSIDIYASWTREHRGNANGSFSAATFSDLDDYGAHRVNLINNVYEDVTPYYVYQGHTNNGRNMPTNNGYFRVYNGQVVQITNQNRRCNDAGGCNYYVRGTNPYNANSSYYRFNNGVMSSYNPTYEEVLDAVIPLGKTTAGYYRKVVGNKVPQGKNYSNYYYEYTGYNSDNTHPNFYSMADSKCNTSGGCSVNNTVIYEMIPYYDEYGNENVAVMHGEYYYLATRDTNIVTLTGSITGGWSSTYDVPFTLTGINNGVQGTSTLTINANNIEIYQDVRIEHIRMNSGQALTTSTDNPVYNSSGVMFGNYHNVKIGRGITRSNNSNATLNAFAGCDSGSSVGTDDVRYKNIIESGFYNATSLTTLGSSSGTLYVDATTVYGCDYDRVNDSDNDNLIVRYCASGSYSGTINNIYNSVDSPILTTIVKSGQFGSNKNDYTAGIYIGGLGGGTHYGYRVGIVEGGEIYNLIGGPLSASSMEGHNDAYIYIKGGEVDVIVGGAGASETYGNRIIQVTDGQINYAVFGGSNGIAGGDAGQYLGKLHGDTYVYIGGNAIIGDATLVSNNANETISEVEAGSVFGAGNGNSSSVGVGSVYNSTVIIDGDATIRKNVYGGGNYGAVGYTSAAGTCSTTVKINGGNVTGNVYGAANNNGAGNTAHSNRVYDQVTGLSYYQAQTYQNNGYSCVAAGSWFNRTYTCTLDVTVNFYNVTANINIEMNGGTVSGSVYGGSKNKGRVTGSTDLDINAGTITHDVYGGGEGGYTDSDAYGTFVGGNVSVSIGNNSSGPTINGSVYGGSAYGTVNALDINQAANNKTTTVTLNRGTVSGSIFGGAKGSSTYTPYVNGNITVTTNGGSATNVFGGFDMAGEPSGNVTVNLNGGTFTNAYGGGNQTSVNTTNINLRGATVGTLYGGSNQAGDVNTSNVLIQSGTVTTAFGGNNSGGTCNTTNVTVNGGNVTNSLYGGGNLVGTNSTTIDINNTSNTFPNVYGGGNSAGATTTTVNLNSQSGNNIRITNLFGGSNQTGNVTTADINVNSGTIGTLYGGNNAGGMTTNTDIDIAGGSLTTVFGGGNEAQSGNTDINITGGSMTTVYGGGNQAGINDDTVINVSGGSINTIYGGGNEGSVGGETNVTITNHSGTITNVFGAGNSAGAITTNVTLATGSPNHINITNLYGGANQLGDVNETIIDINSGTITNVYGGNNAGGTTSESNITMTNGSVTTMYGGGNEAVTTTTDVDITGGTVTTIYGGGNEATTTSTNVDVSGGSITTIFGGGNKANVTNSTIIDVTNHTGTITSIYGGGNKAGASSTNINLNKSTNGNLNVTNVFGGSNQSGAVSVSHVVVNDATISSLYGGNNAGGTTDSTIVDVINGTITDIYGGGNEAVSGSTNVTIEDGTITNIYGGGNKAGVNNNTSLVMTGGTVNQNVYGGGNEGVVGGRSDVLIQDATINGSVYGGGNAAGVNNDTSLTVINGTVGQNLYGGGNEGTVSGSTNVLIHNTAINGSAYGGGNGNTATVHGNTSITVSGSSVVGTSTCVKPSNCSVFGGGNAAYTGSDALRTSTASVKITGAEVYGNVYGGANTSVVYGRTHVDIGADVPTGTNITRGDINIHGTVFGGGEANAEGSESYTYDFISVTNGIDVNINANNYNNFDIGGSIFGSGNASNTSGTSTITIKNYGTFNNPERNISIQRTHLLTIDNSAIILEGATDRTNEYSDRKFTLSRIGELDLKDNSTLFLEKGCNLLESFKSLDSNNDYAEVNISVEDGTIDLSTDNRIYILVERNNVINIAKDQSITSYGEVYGMTFFGMYKYNSNDTVNTGIYGKYDYGDNLAWSGVFDNFSTYVLGLHKTSHDIEKDGFYTNYITPDPNNPNAAPTNVPNYITPTPPTGQLYMWNIGEGVIEYEVDLTASKYSTLGTTELSLIDFTDPNTSFQVLDFDYSELAPGVSLVEKQNISKIAPNETIADNVMGITFETSNVGWLANSSTQFVSNSTKVVGDRDYIGGNNAGAPTILIYLFHSKNIASAGDMGTVRVQLNSIKQIDALTKETKRLNISINISRLLFDTINYEGAMTAGRKYDLFSSSATNITSSSSISAYYSLFNEGATIYRPGYHRALVSNYVLPLNTKITMIDLSGNNPEYYYHIIDSNDVNTTTEELRLHHEIAYNLSMFEVMGALGSGVYYDDTVKNNQYFSNNYCNEDFIFIIDFGDTNISANALQNKLLMEIRDSNNETIYSVLAPQHDNLVYNIYVNTDANLDVEGSISTNKIYNGESFTADLTIDYTQSLVGSTTIYDTHYFDSKLGIRLSFINSDNEVVTGTTLLGLTYTIDGNTYYPNIDGTARIKIADKVDSAEKWIIINTGTSKIASGNYKFRVETFGSSDGIYFGLNPSDTKEFNIEVVNEIYGLDAEINPEEMIIYGADGVTSNGLNNITYKISYNSGLQNPRINFKLYRRKYDHEDDTDFVLVNAKDYFDNAFVNGFETNEYVLRQNPGATTNYSFMLKDNLVTGTYKIEFILYGDSSVVGTLEKYIIIK